eukprot:12382086-Alexandrium_andersonii.AAC.1
MSASLVGSEMCIRDSCRDSANPMTAVSSAPSAGRLFSSWVRGRIQRGRQWTFVHEQPQQRLMQP